MYNCFNLAVSRRFHVLILGVCLALATVSHAAIVDDFSDGTFCLNWVTNNYPQYSNTPNDGVTFTELNDQLSSRDGARRERRCFGFLRMPG